MKKKIMLMFATLIVLAMGIVAFAYTTNGTDTPQAKASCTCCGDSCPMKNKDAKADCDCCGDSCPMKTGDKSSMSGMDMKDGKAMKDCPCCHHNMDKKDTTKTGV